MFRSDTDIHQDIVSELKWEPSVRDDDIALGVRDGIVTLAGFVDSFADKWTAERVASTVKGVKAVANDLEVRLPSSSTRSDPEIARAAVDALTWSIAVPQDRIKVRVAKGWLTLEGDVDWYYQREAAESAVRHLVGVMGVSTLITIKALPTPSDVTERIKDALKRGAQFEAERITVQVQGHKAILRGTVHSYVELLAATRAARNAAGVTDVENELRVDPYAFASV